MFSITSESSPITTLPVVSSSLPTIKKVCVYIDWHSIAVTRELIGPVISELINFARPTLRFGVSIY